MNQTISQTTGLLTSLRQLSPNRLLTTIEAKAVAEKQAARLRRALNTDTGQRKLDISRLEHLLGVTIRLEPGMPTSGALLHTTSGWLIVVSQDEPRVRRRFSVLHEVKHLLDDHITEQNQPTSLSHNDLQAEAVCNYFAACSLIPKTLLLQDWTTGKQNLALLARTYGVSKEAMLIRLNELGLIELPPPKPLEPFERQGQPERRKPGVSRSHSPASALPT